MLWPGRIYLRRRGPSHFNAVIVEHEGDFWKYFLAVRDYLRSHPEEVADYTKAKWEAVAAGTTTFLDYSQEKAPFLKELSGRALRWKFTGMGSSSPERGEF